MTQSFKVPTLLVFYFYSLSFLAQSKFVFPFTEKNEITVNYHGVLVPENYTWLENTTDSHVAKWVDKQNLYTDSFFNNINYLAKLEKNIKDKSTYSLRFPALRKSYSFEQFMKGERLSKQDYEKSLPALYYREKNDLRWTELIDPVEFRKSPKENIIITNYVLSDDEKYLAFCISRNGSDWNEIRVLDMRSKKTLNEVIIWVKHNSIVWHKDGFFYQKYEEPPEGQELLAKNTHESLYYHQLNTSASTDILLPVQNCERLEVLAPDHLVIHTQENVKGKLYYIVSILGADKKNWIQDSLKKFIIHPALTRYDVDVLSIKNDSALVRNNFLADKGMVAYFNIKGVNEFSTLVPSYKEVLVYSFFRLGKLHCLYKNDSSFMMLRVNLKGEREKIYEFGKHMAVSQFQFETQKVAYYMESSYDRPPILNRFNFETYQSAMVNKTAIYYDPSECVTRRVEYASSDGTLVSMDLFYKKGLQINENTPVILTAYGGFGIITSPSYDYSNVLWMENGGIYAQAYIRGGGEKGKKWHMAGSGKNKQQCITDFIYAAKFLIENKYTSPDRLAITGASHGGLVVAAAANQEPGMFKAVIPVVGVFDMINYEKYTIGDYVSDEFGTAADSSNFMNLYKYSPIHNIKEGIKYPATLIMTGDHDDRVPPLHSYKYTAYLQEKSDKTNPVLLHVNANFGHYGAFNKKAAVREDVYKLAFLFKVMGIKPVFND